MTKNVCAVKAVQKQLDQYNVYFPVMPTENYNQLHYFVEDCQICLQESPVEAPDIDGNCDSI